MQGRCAYACCMQASDEERMARGTNPRRYEGKTGRVYVTPQDQE